MTDHALDASPRGELRPYPILRWLAIATAVAPAAIGVGLLIQITQLRPGGYGEPGKPDAIEGLLLLVFAGVHFGFAIAYVVCAAGVWYRKRWSFIAVAVLCAAQGIMHGHHLLSASHVGPAEILYAAYTLVLATCAVFAVLTLVGVRISF
jgi:hypothetical protein